MPLLEKISDLFEVCVVKILSAVDARGRSHQHEIGGLIKAGLGKRLGMPEDGRHLEFPTEYVWLEDEQMPCHCVGKSTWYDTRYGKSNRGPEFRLYYESNEVTNRFTEGSELLIGLTKNERLILICCPPRSESAHQVRMLFALEETPSEQWRSINLEANPFQLPLRFLLRELFDIDAAPTDETKIWLENAMDAMPSSWRTQFPSSGEFSKFVRERSVTDDVCRADPDGALMTLWEHEELCFRRVEFEIARNNYVEALGSPFDFLTMTQQDMDTLVQVSISQQNRRKSRAGAAFEHHIDHILTVNNVEFSHPGKTEARKRPDFLFPNDQAYHDRNFPMASLRMLGAKTTCKDRWRQILNEADRIPCKHLITIQKGISEEQTDEMRQANVRLVVPTPLFGMYSERQRPSLMTFHQFIGEVLELQNKRRLV